MYSRALGTLQSANCLTAMCSVQTVLGDNGALTANTGLWAYAKRKCTTASVYQSHRDLWTGEVQVLVRDSGH